MAAAPKPPPRLLKTWQDAEDYAAEYVRWLGWADAHSTRRTSDEGIDVLGTHRTRGTLVAQVKMEGKPVESKVVRDLRGSGTVVGAKTHLMFALAGYKAPAIDWADRAEVALFEFAFDGSVTAVNEHAAKLVSTRSRSRATASTAKAAPAPAPAHRRSIAQIIREDPLTVAARSAKTPTGAAASLRENDLRFLSAIESWERQDRSHLLLDFQGRGGPKVSHMLESEIGLPANYASAAYPDLRRYFNAEVFYRDKMAGIVMYKISGIKPTGVKALREWGIPVQPWRG